MPIKKSALLLLALAISSVSLLVFSSDTPITTAKGVPKVKCCQQLNKSDVISPWSILSQSMLRTKA
ncbi:MAG: hypothetical protein H7334_04190 [Ferruginibacter sp.]|nr:hypothetical protein [Ferruginibacter sp.]